jgi:hypothetical protein
MALLSFADSAPRAYWLKAGNAYLTFSTSTGTSPPLLVLRSKQMIHIRSRLDTARWAALKRVN